MIMITEVIPKCQTNPIASALLHLDGYEPHFNFDLKEENLGGSGIRLLLLCVKSISYLRMVPKIISGWKL